MGFLEAVKALFVFYGFWPTTATVELKTIAVSAFVFAVIQVLKQAPVLQPYIVGWKAVALNVVLSIVGVLMALQPDQVLSTQTFLTVLAAALAAAGIHGTTTTLRQQARVRAMVKADAIAKEAEARRQVLMVERRNNE